MFSDKNYVVKSLELHLFFARIMKEHSLFLAAGFTPANSNFTKEALFYKQEFEKILATAVMLGNGVIGCDVLSSCELVTQFTEKAESQTENFTGIPINRQITQKECELRCEDNLRINSSLIRRVSELNRTALRCVKGLIKLKENVLQKVLSCEMFTANYPLLIEHILREARLYCTFIEELERGTKIDCDTMRQTELFWNQIMMEHALFMRGLLDPTENELIETSHCFAKEYKELLCKAKEATDETILHNESIKETLKFKEFKTAGAKGIQECKIKSIILPLLADHVLREANHYLRLLRE